MIDAVNEAFDRPALTTDIIVGFPGENDEEFQHTLEVVDRARFIGWCARLSAKSSVNHGSN